MLSFNPETIRPPSISNYCSNHPVNFLFLIYIYIYSMPLTVSKIIKFNRIHESFLTSPLHLMMLLLKFQRRRRRSPRVLPFLIGLPRHKVASRRNNRRRESFTCNMAFIRAKGRRGKRLGNHRLTNEKRGERRSRAFRATC